MSTKADAMQTITFTVPLPPAGLRRNHETRSHAYRAKLKDEYSEAVWIAAQDGDRYWTGNFAVGAGARLTHIRTRGVRVNDAPWPKAKLTLVWKHHRVGPDEDNALASCKALIDCLTTKGRRPLGIVVDDSSGHLSVTLRTEKVRAKAEEGVLVTIQRSDV